MWADDRALRWRKISIHFRKKNNEKNVPKNVFHQSDLFLKRNSTQIVFCGLATRRRWFHLGGIPPTKWFLFNFCWNIYSHLFRNRFCFGIGGTTVDYTINLYFLKNVVLFPCVVCREEYKSRDFLCSKRGNGCTADEINT